MNHSTNDNDHLDTLFVSLRPMWPQDRGYRVHGFHMAQALSDQGQRVGIACVEPNPAGALIALTSMTRYWPNPDAVTEEMIASAVQAMRGPMAKARLRMVQYLSEIQTVAGVIQLVQRHQPKRVIALGLDGVILLSALRDQPNLQRVWYAADEMAYFHASCLRHESLRHWPARLRSMLEHTSIERLFGRHLDAVIGVSPRDTTWLQRITGSPSVCIPNGVDLDRFQTAPHSCADMSQTSSPSTRTITQRSVVFWGNYTFEPNHDAVMWFAQHVWPLVRTYCHGARWQIIGRGVTDDIRALGHQPGIEIVGEVTNIAEAAAQSAAAVLPIRCGGGIKNKLLEAMAMGMPVVASPTAVAGLGLETGRHAMICNHPMEYVNALTRIWSDTALRHRLARESRHRVETHHNWAQAATNLMTNLNDRSRRANHDIDTQQIETQTDATRSNQRSAA